MFAGAAAGTSAGLAAVMTYAGLGLAVAVGWLLRASRFEISAARMVQAARNPARRGALGENSFGMAPLNEMARLTKTALDELDAAELRVAEAEAFSRNLIRTANVMIVELDKADRIESFNQTAEETLGFKETEMKGMRWSEVVRKEENGKASKDTEFKSRKTFEAKITKRSGEELLISWQVNAVRKNGERSGTICFGTDITEKKKQEEQRLALERKLLDAQKLESLGVLAGGIAHDFNNLLAAILGNANLAALHVRGKEPTEGYMRNIEKASLRAADLCKQMLAYSGRGRFLSQHMDLNEVVRETVDLLEVSITKKASLRVEFRPDLPAVHGDPAQIRQVVMNLVINASEAIGEHSGLIRVRTGTMQADAEFFKEANAAPNLPAGEYVFVEVSDTGSGMSPETLAKIFDPFFTTKFTGRGLGLAAVQGIVRSHNGVLKVTSEVSKGTAFKFLLPIAQEQPQPEEAPMPADLEPWRGQGTILVVDDDPTVRAVTSRLVEASGFQVLQAVDGRHGVQVFAENREEIRAVVLDMAMPNLDGKEAFEEMRRLQPDVKVLLISGFGENFTADSFNGSRPCGFLQKPFMPEQLNLKLKSICTERRGRLTAPAFAHN